MSRDLVQGLYLNGPTVLDWWATVRGPQLPHSPASVPGLQVVGLNLRNTNSPGISPFDQQSLRLFPNPNPADPRTLVALGTAGGSLIVLRPGVPGRTAA